MRILMVSKALVVAAYRQKLAEIAAQPEVDELTAVVPPMWQEPGGRSLALERQPERGYRLRVEPIRFNGNFHLFHWPGLARVIAELRPDLVHIDEEPYNLATALATWHSRRVGARSLFFTWQNLRRRYPPPFSTFERYVFRLSAYAIAGNAEAVDVLRAKGYGGPAAVIPQFGVDPDTFAPRPPAGHDDGFTLGYVARLAEEKGVRVLMRALAGLDGRWRLHVIGSGPLADEARLLARRAGIADRVTWEPSVPSTSMPDRLRSFDALVLPSLTRPNWKEQFGRALVEAMACGVAVVGSDSGEIPHVIGDAGLVVPEGNAEALRAALSTLMADPTRRQELGARGRDRVRAHYTHRSIAEQTLAVYRAALT